MLPYLTKMMKTGALVLTRLKLLLQQQMMMTELRETTMKECSESFLPWCFNIKHLHFYDC